MIEIGFMTGNERHMPLPSCAATAGLTHRFTVLQDNTHPVRVPDTTFDEGLWRALLAFIARHDPSARVAIAEAERDVARNERPLSDYMAHWDTLDDNRDPPAVVTLRTEAALRLCMVTEPYYLCGGPWPYADACVHSLFSDRDISEEVMAFLRGHADAPRWRFAEEVLRAEDIAAPTPLERARPLLGWALIFILVAIYAAIRGAG